MSGRKALSQMPVQIIHSHCRQSAFVPSHLEKLLYVEGVLHVEFDKHVESKLKLAFHTSFQIL